MGIYASTRILEIETESGIEKIEIRKRYPVSLVRKYGDLAQSKISDGSSLDLPKWLFENGVLRFLTNIEIDGEMVTLENAYEQLSKEHGLFKPLLKAVNQAMKDSSTLFETEEATGNGSNSKAKEGDPKPGRKKKAANHVPRKTTAAKPKVS